MFLFFAVFPESFASPVFKQGLSRLYSCNLLCCLSKRYISLSQIFVPSAIKIITADIPPSFQKTNIYIHSQEMRRCFNFIWLKLVRNALCYCGGDNCQSRDIQLAVHYQQVDNHVTSNSTFRIIMCPHTYFSVVALQLLTNR